LWSRKFVHVGGGVGAADGEGDGAALSVAETAGLGIVPGTPGDIAGDVPKAPHRERRARQHRLRRVEARAVSEPLLVFVPAPVAAVAAAEVARARWRRWP